MENGREKQVIYLKDMIFRALHQWKVILVVAIAFAVLLGAFALKKDGESVDLGGLNMTPETQQKVEQMKTRKDYFEKQVEKQREYIATAACMAIDPYATYTCGFHLYPEATYEEPITEFTPMAQDTIVLVRAYRSLLLDSSTYDILAQQFDYTARDLRDMIVFDQSAEGTLGIRIYGNDPEELQQLANVMKNVAQEGQEAIQQDIHSHNLKVISFKSGPAYDTLIVEKQNEAYKLLNDYENSLTTATNELQRYAPTELIAESGNPVLYAIIGAVIGAFLVVCVVWLIHLCSDKIYSARVLENRTGVRVLGCTDSGKKRFFIDAWLRKLEGRSKGEEAALAANIRNRCNGGKTILFMGSFDSNALTGVVSALEQAGITCKACQTKAEALETLPDCDGVVLAETCNVSLYAQVEWAMQTISDCQKNLIGCVLIDG